MVYFLNLPKELQIEIAKKFFETCTSNAWEINISGLKVAIEIKTQEMWMEQESKMSLIQWFHLHWPSDKAKIVIDCVEDVNLKFMGYPLIFTSVISNQVFSYFALYFLNDELIYIYSALFSNSYCLNNPLNVKV